jgi:hypothetical protein
MFYQFTFTLERLRAMDANKTIIEIVVVVIVVVYDIWLGFSICVNFFCFGRLRATDAVKTDVVVDIVVVEVVVAAV